MLLMTLKGIKRMLDKACTMNIESEVKEIIISVENAKGMLEELITELEKKPPKAFHPTTPILPGPGNAETCSCEDYEEKSDGTCGKCGLTIDFENKVRG